MPSASYVETREEQAVHETKWDTKRPNEKLALTSHAMTSVTVATSVWSENLGKLI